MPDRQQFIRDAVNRAFQSDSEQIQDANSISLEQLQDYINTVLFTISPKPRRDAAKLFKKLVDQVQSELSH